MHDLRQFHSDYFLTRDEVNGFKNEVRRAMHDAQVSEICYPQTHTIVTLHRTWMPLGCPIPATLEIRRMAVRVLAHALIDGRPVLRSTRSVHWISTMPQDFLQVLAITASF